MLAIFKNDQKNLAIICVFLTIPRIEIRILGQREKGIHRRAIAAERAFIKRS